MTALLVGGSLWGLARFLLLLFFVAARLSTGLRGVLPWLLAVSAPGLVLPAGWMMYALFPRRHARYLPLLKLGQLLGMASLVLLAAAGSLVFPAEAPLLRLGQLAVTRSTIVIGLVLALDGAFLAALFALPVEPE